MRWHNHPLWHVTVVDVPIADSGGLGWTNGNLIPQLRFYKLQQLHVHYFLKELFLICTCTHEETGVFVFTEPPVLLHRGGVKLLRKTMKNIVLHFFLFSFNILMMFLYFF